jgi:ComF family protein
MTGLKSILHYAPQSPNLAPMLTLPWSFSFTRFLVPPTCASCSVLTAEAQALCPACWKKLHFISRPFCEKYAVPFSYDKAVDALSPEAYRYPPPWQKARAVALFKDLAPDLVHGLKYKDRHDFAPLMGRLMIRAGQDVIDEADCIAPVPLHWSRFLKRRYNQAALLAKAVAKESGKTIMPRLLRRRKPTHTQVGLSREARERNLQGAFLINEKIRPFIKDRTVLLVDDVMTSGATLGAASRALLRGGAKAVNVLVFARVTEVLD